jgi:hypothetical protein
MAPLIDRLRDHAVLEHRLEEILHVVDDHLRAGISKRDVGEIGLPTEGGGERDRGPRRRVVDDLGHRAALIHSIWKILQDSRVRRQIVVRDVLAMVVMGEAMVVSCRKVRRP